MTSEGKLELSDIEVGKDYKGAKYIQPGYLANSILTVVKKGRKNVTVKHPAYSDKFSVAPEYLLKL